jgi:hypothetical protein
VGGALTVLRNDGNGGFTRVSNAVLQQPLSSDATGLAAFGQSPDMRLVLAGRSGYEAAPPGSAVLKFDLKRNQMDPIPAASSTMSGPLALADIDGDGDLDLFVGGRCRPGQSVPASSFVSQ